MNKVFSLSCVRLSAICFASLSLLFFAGCAMKHSTVAEEKRIELSAKTEASGVYSSGPLTVSYNYRQSGATLTISGSVDYRRRVDSLDVRMAFLDAAGLVLDKNIVYSSGFRSLASRDSTRTFRSSLGVPPGAVAFSFMESIVVRSSRR